MEACMPELMANGRNYRIWKKSAEIILAAEGRTEHINGPDSIVTETLEHLDKVLKRDAQVMGFIFFNIEEIVQSAVLTESTAKAMWEAINRLYGGGL